MTINNPEVVAELQALYPRCENALVTNDVDTLMAMFWAGPQVMRFGAPSRTWPPHSATPTVFTIAPQPA